jgi:hypothetical protein
MRHTAYNSGHAAPLHSAQICPIRQTSHIPGTLYAMPCLKIKNYQLTGKTLEMVMKNEIEELKEKIHIPKSPYHQQSSGVTLIYTLPAYRFNDILPGFFETYPNIKRVWFAIDIFK